MINLYNADCLSAMLEMADNQFDLAIVDPPYGAKDAIGLTNCINMTKQKAQRTNYKVFDNKQPSKQYFDELKRVSKNQVIWGANFYTHVNLAGGRIVWNKHGTAFGEGEIAYNSQSQAIRFFDYIWNGMIQQNMRNKEKRIHPTQKPVALYKWILHKYAKAGDTILDTHLGSGSIAIACHDMGFDLTAYEIDEEYFDAASNRLKQHQRQLKLF